jgi:2-desacetyl-2-hydroxyethyl bacteriochlorophyllide A dehydrogenase
MKAIVKKGYGAGRVEFCDVQKPVVGDYDVLIQIKAAGICGSDLELVYGTVEGKTVDYPIVIGHEFAGIIGETGSKVTAWKCGDRVVSDNTGYVCGSCHACSAGDYLNCSSRKGMGNDMNGGFAEYALIPGQVLNVFPSCLYRIPDNVSFEHAALLDPLCNAYKSIVQEGLFCPGENIVVFGIGALGLFSIQIASIIGASNIIVVRQSKAEDTRSEMAKKLGANYIFSSKDENLVDSIANITGKDGVPLIIDCAGDPVVLKQSIEIVRNGGKIIKIGYSKKPIDFSLDKFALKGLSLIGHMGYDSTSWRNCLNLLEAKKIQMDLVISHRMLMEEWQKGFELVKNRQATKVVLFPENR